MNRASGVHRVDAHGHDAAGTISFEPIGDVLYVPKVPHVARLILVRIYFRREDDFGGLRVELQRVSSGPEAPEVVASAPLGERCLWGDVGVHFDVSFERVELEEEE